MHKLLQTTGLFLLFGGIGAIDGDGQLFGASIAIFAGMIILWEGFVIEERKKNRHHSTNNKHINRPFFMH